MTPPHPFHILRSKFFGPVSEGLWNGLTAFGLGAISASLILAMMRRGSRISHVVQGAKSMDEKNLEELIAEKERLEDLIAEVAARQGKK